MPSASRASLYSLCLALLAIWCIGIFGRGFWTPDEPREADIAWRMSFQQDKAVPLLAGVAFCEKPPLAYWAAALPMRWLGDSAQAARLPNLLYALLTASALALLAGRVLGRFAALVAAAAGATLLLAYQVAIWLATDAPLVAAVSVALIGLYRGWHAASSRQRLAYYCLMHTALGLAFLCKSGAAWMVPVLAFAVLMLWERRWRELLRWELYAGLVIQAALILTWVWFVYIGADGLEHLKTFFWNNLVGRFTQVDAPAELQYAAAHRNSPGKYLLELPVYLFPWDFLVIAALHRAWRRRRELNEAGTLVRFALAVFFPSLLLLSMAATARNIYLAPALPGIALLLAWWAKDVLTNPNRIDRIALKSTALLLILAALVIGAASYIAGLEAWSSMNFKSLYVLVAGLGLIAALVFACRAFVGDVTRDLPALFLAYAALLIGPVSQLYGRADEWQSLAAIGARIKQDLNGQPLALYKADETTRAMVDMYATTQVTLWDGRAAGPRSGWVLAQLPGRGAPRSKTVAGLLKYKTPATAVPGMPALTLAHTYELPNGRRYALFLADR